MRYIKTTLYLILTLAVFGYSQNQTNHWSIIKDLLKTGDHKDMLELEEYLQGLSSAELLKASKECAADIEQRIKPEDWDVAVMNLGFFHKYYPRKTNNLQNISPLLNDLQDKSQSKCWRHLMIQLISVEWYKNLSVEQQIESAEVIKGIYKDPCEPAVLRTKAVRGATRLLLDAHKSNLYDDPVVQKLLKQGKDKEAVFKKAAEGKIELSDTTLQQSQQIEAQIDGLIQSQLELFNDPNIPTDMRSKIIANFANLRGFDDSGKIKTTLQNAVENYTDYDEKLWQQLVRTNIVYFNNKQTASALPQMLDKVKNRNNKRDLQRLKTQIDKNNPNKQISSPAMPVKQPRITN